MASYLFIDGEYLRVHFAQQMQAFYGMVPAIAFERVASDLGGTRTYYYDAVDYDKRRTESEGQHETRVAARRAEHDYISGLPGFHVREGHVRHSPKQRRQQKAVQPKWVDELNAATGRHC